ncbi:UNVERIFIED_CONTAM: hypothetical protein GTU68_064341 [Idotea baltica]|nr:hypothetical protein [Idotea baltica]
MRSGTPQQRPFVLRLTFMVVSMALRKATLRSMVRRSMSMSVMPLADHGSYRPSRPTSICLTGSASNTSTPPVSASSRSCCTELCLVRLSASSVCSWSTTPATSRPGLHLCKSRSSRSQKNTTPMPMRSLPHVRRPDFVSTTSKQRSHSESESATPRSRRPRMSWSWAATTSPARLLA